MAYEGVASEVLREVGQQLIENDQHKTLPTETLDLMFDSWKKQGNEFFQKNEFPAAIKCYTTCTELIPRNVVGFTNRALCYLRINEYAKAEDDCTKALILENKNLKALFRRAQARKALGMYDRCKEDLEKLLFLDKKNSAARRELAIVSKLQKCSRSGSGSAKVQGTCKCTANISTKPSKDTNNTEVICRLFKNLANEFCSSKMYYYSFLRALPDDELRQFAFKNKLGKIVQLMQNFTDKKFTSPHISPHQITTAQRFVAKFREEHLENRKVKYPVDMPAPEVSIVIDVENDDDFLYGDRNWDPNEGVRGLYWPCLDKVIGYRLWCLKAGNQILASKYEGQFLMRVNPVLNILKIHFWLFKPIFSTEILAKINAKEFSNDVIKEVVQNGERAENSRQYRVDIPLHFMSKLYLYAPNGIKKEGMLIIDSDIEPSFYKRAVHWNVASQNLWQHVDDILGFPEDISEALSKPPYRICLGGVVSELMDVVAIMMETAPHLKDLYEISEKEPFSSNVGGASSLTRNEAMLHKLHQHCGLNIRPRYKNPKPVPLPVGNPILQKRRTEILDVLVKHGLLLEKYANDARYNLVNARDGTHVKYNNLLGQLGHYFGERNSCLFDYLNFKCKSAQELHDILSHTLDGGEMMCQIIDPYGDRLELDEDEDRDFDEMTVAEYIQEPYDGEVFYSVCFRRLVDQDEEYHCPSCHECINWNFWHCSNCHQCSKGHSAKYCEHCERDVNDNFEPIPNSVYQIHKHALALSKSEEEEEEEMHPRQQNQMNAQMEQNMNNPLYHHYPEQGSFSRILSSKCGGSCYDWEELAYDLNIGSGDREMITNCNLDDNLHRSGIIGQYGIYIARFLQKDMDNSERCMLMKTTPAQERAQLRRIYDSMTGGRDISDCCIQ